MNRLDSCIIAQLFWLCLMSRSGARFALLLALSGQLGFAWAAGPSDCGHDGVRVDGRASGLYLTAACEAIRDTWEYFRRIGLSSEPRLSVRFVEQGSKGEGPAHPSYAYADRASSRIVAFVYSDRQPWGLPWSDAWVQSFLRHELVHLAVWHFLGAKARTLPREWHEFIAYAIQLDLMAPGLRDRVLANFGSVRAFDSAAEVNEFIYGMDPEGFAVASYKTYLQGGESKLVSQLLIRAAQGWEMPPSLAR